MPGQGWPLFMRCRAKENMISGFGGKVGPGSLGLWGAVLNICSIGTMLKKEVNAHRGIYSKE